jgi:hypothetical protein
MRNRIERSGLWLLAAVSLAAQTQSADAPMQLPADHPSNGVLELSVAQALEPDPPKAGHRRLSRSRLAWAADCES